MHTELSAEQQSYLERLAVPFHPDAINWRVTNKSRDGKRGCVIPYGDQRAYTDRLNEIVTPAGWTRTYEVTTLSPVTRVKKDKAIQTGKVIVTCVVSIHGLGSHSGSGEMWADDDNAMTRAEAQAFNGHAPVLGLAATSTIFPRCGLISMSTVSQPALRPCQSGRYRLGWFLARSISRFVPMHRQSQVGRMEATTVPGMRNCSLFPYRLIPASRNR
jgi:hypothetical protein